jgi:hypothetical protein
MIVAAANGDKLPVLVTRCQAAAVAVIDLNKGSGAVIIDLLDAEAQTRDAVLQLHKVVAHRNDFPLLVERCHPIPVTVVNLGKCAGAVVIDVHYPQAQCRHSVLEVDVAPFWIAFGAAARAVFPASRQNA